MTEHFPQVFKTYTCISNHSSKLFFRKKNFVTSTTAQARQTRAIKGLRLTSKIFSNPVK